MTASLQVSRGQLIASAAVLALVAGGAGFGIARLTGPKDAPATSSPAGKGKVLYWYDPMVPSQHFDKPGESPFMDMQLVPRYEGEGGDNASMIKIDPGRLQNLGVRLVYVTQGDFSQSFDVAGSLDFNQRDVAIVQARANGFVQRVYAHAPGDVVPAGAPIADILMPSWGGAQAEYLAVRRSGDASLEAAARQRLLLLGMPQDLIDHVAKSGQAKTVVTVSTPVGGAIQSLDVRQGMTVAMGQSLAQVTSLSSVWLTAAVPESLADQVKVGQQVKADLAAFPGEPVSGRVSAILPSAQVESRTLSVRIELGNRGGRLRPGMFATVHLLGNTETALSVPTEALIRTGKRTLVMLADGKGSFTPAEVQTGRESAGRTEILAGLAEGDKVVASGQFLIDSEASLAGLSARPVSGSSAPASSPAALLETRGVIEAMKGDSITLSHQPVPQMGWPSMTMTFTLSSASLGNGFKVGDHVVFGFQQQASGPVIEKLARDSQQTTAAHQ